MIELRLQRAQRLLAQNGVVRQVSVAGQTEDVLAVQAPLTELVRVRELATQLKALGFKYVAIELNAEDRV